MRSRVRHVLTRRALIVGLTTALAACSGKSNTAAEAPKGLKAPLHLGALVDYVPAAGLRWMVVGRPSTIGESPSFRDSVQLLLPSERLNGFAAGSGVDLREIETALIAGFDYGTLYLFTPPAGASDLIVRRFRERLVAGERTDAPHPDLERVTGIVGQTPQTLVRIDQHAIAIAVGDPTLARIAEAFARKRLHQSPTALRGAALSQLSAAPEQAVATFYAPGPFVGEWAHGARGLLANAVALRASVLEKGAARASVVLELSGDFPPSGADDLSAGFADLAQSSTGKLLGLDQPTSPPVVREREGRLILEVDIAVAPVARGLRAAVIADVWEIFDLPRPQKPPP